MLFILISLLFVQKPIYSSKLKALDTEWHSTYHPGKEAGVLRNELPVVKMHLSVCDGLLPSQILHLLKGDSLPAGFDGSGNAVIVDK